MLVIIKLFYAMLFIIGGMALIKYRKIVHGWTGNFVWAEQYLGYGGTYLVLILAGLLMIFYGVVYPFGGIEFILGK